MMPSDKSENRLRDVDPGIAETARPSGRKLLIGLTLALAAWGVYHAFGVFFGGFGAANLGYDFRRSLVVLASMGAFLGIWWLLILSRNRRLDRTNGTRPPI
jgi:hypothetical protein